jgi:hypothetical protein
MSSYKGKIYQYDLDGNFISEYKNVVSAAFIVNTNSANIYSSIKGNKKYVTVAGFYWSTKQYTKLPKELLKKNRPKVCQYDLNMKLIREYDHAVDAVKYGFTEVGISSCLSPNNSQITHRGFIWKYKD